MTGCAFALFDRSVEIFFPLKILFDVAQRWSAEIVFVVAVQAGGHFIKRQEPLVSGIVGRVTGTTATCLTQWFMRYLYSHKLFAYFVMAANAEVRDFLLKNFAGRRSMWIMTGGAGTVLNRWMGNFGLIQILGKIRMACKADNADGSVEKCFFIRFMRLMTLVAGADSNGTVHERLIEGFGVVTGDTEFRAIFAYIQ